MFSKYEYVYAIYKEKNFTRAAQQLYISQPSLSAAIKKIEAGIGAPLFERGGNGVTLTQVGREYIAACEKISNIKKEFEAKLNDIYNLETGHITVGGTNYLSSYILPRIINRFKTKYPKIEVTLTEAKSSTLEEKLKNEQLDIVIDSFDEIPAVYTGYELSRERILLCVPSTWEINNKLRELCILPEHIYNANLELSDIPSVSLKLFKNENFIILKSGNDMHTRAMRFFSDTISAPKISFSVDQLNISYSMSESGIGASFITDTYFKYAKFHNDVCLYNIDSNYCTRTLYIAHNKNKYCTAAMKKFIETAQEII